ncbi:MAG: DUF2510 domain-containing protein, partial [Actinobacteria bacterium]|nr:DUF2510 domain-containing protein [Actinomycetota bacterium]
MSNKAGWYRDPYGDELRWWDGGRWTDWVVDDPAEPSAPPIPASASVPSHAPEIPAEAPMPGVTLDASGRILHRAQAQEGFAGVDSGAGALASSRPSTSSRPAAAVPAATVPAATGFAASVGDSGTAAAAGRRNAAEAVRVERQRSEQQAYAESQRDQQEHDQQQRVRSAQHAAAQNVAAQQMAAQQAAFGQSTPPATTSYVGYQQQATVGSARVPNRPLRTRRGSTPSAAGVTGLRNLGRWYFIAALVIFGVGSCAVPLLRWSVNSSQSESVTVDPDQPMSDPAWGREVERACALGRENPLVPSNDLITWNPAWSDEQLWRIDLVNAVDECVGSAGPPTTDGVECGPVDGPALLRGPRRYHGSCVTMIVEVTERGTADLCLFHGVWDHPA